VTYTKTDARPTATFKISSFENLKEKNYITSSANASRMAIINTVHKLATELNYLYGEYSSVSKMVRWPKYIQ
jgi:hypothetical protein